QLHQVDKDLWQRHDLITRWFRRFYCTPAVPFWIQNSISRVRPETTSSPPAVTAQRIAPRPCEYATTAMTTASAAPTGAITFPTQLTRFKTVPSGWAAVCPCTA